MRALTLPFQYTHWNRAVRISEVTKKKKRKTTAEGEGEKIMEDISRNDFKYLFKILVIGDVGVGKTSLIRRFTKGYFAENISSTVGVDVDSKILNIHGDKVKLQCWDTAGQEKHRSITQSYYRNADAVIMVFDLTNRGSFASIPQWLMDVQRYTTKNAVKVLVGNKTDLKGAKRMVNSRSAANLAEFEDLLYIETSAKWDDNIETLFTELAEQLRENAKSRNLNRQNCTTNYSVVKKTFSIVSYIKKLGQKLPIQTTATLCGI